MPDEHELAETLAATLDVPDASPFAAALAARPRVIGRFELDEELGAGAMGTVFAGWDRQLQRRVALKFLRRLADDPDGERRLLREAQGLAQLSHQNVVPVYDVGRHEGRVWIAMEYVPGQTLRAWAEEATREPAAILDHWLAVGRGLAAIHAAGLVHRDIKPDNILLGDDGRVRIVDFGLVCAVGTRVMSSSASISGSTDDGISNSDDALGQSLTRADTFLGTPAYAAPEQHEGRQADARSDQYAYCVSVWEALSGERPSRRQREANGLVPMPRAARLAKPVRLALSRGLSLDPEDRFADMDSLIAALTPRSRARRVAVASVLGSVSLSLVTVLGALVTRSEHAVDTPQPCAEAGAGVDRVWTTDRRTSLAEHLDADVANHGLALLDDWVERWREADIDGCERHRVELRDDDPTHARVLQCLDRELADFEALLALADAGRLGEADTLIAELGRLDDPARCLSASAQADESPTLPASKQAELERLRRALLRARDLDGSLDARLEAVAALRPAITALSWTPLSGQLALITGRLELARGNATAGLRELGLAIDIAEANRDIELAADAWSGVIAINRELEFDAGATRWAWTRRQAVLERHGASLRQRARLEAERGLLLRMEQHYAEAESALRSADALFARAEATAAWEHAAALRDLANLLSFMGRADEAKLEFERARALELGGSAALERPRSKPSAIAHFNEAVAAINSGELDAAQRSLETALELGVRDYGPRSPVVVNAHVALAKVHEQRGELTEARRHGEEAERLSRVAFGAAHPYRGDALSVLGTLAYREGRGPESVAAFERALTLAEFAEPPDPLGLAMAQSNLADGLRLTGEIRRARELATDALQLLENLGPEHPSLVHPLKTLGALELATDHPELAREHLSRALSLHEQSADNPVELAEVLDLLAHAELTLGDETSAREHARRAMATYAELGEPWSTEAARLEAWLSR